uniref:Alstrom syndrome protein 1 n=1 Tax=Gongylonema pulchrum TaxID=637853 RepID=A0A183CW11_9BILA
LEQFIGEWLTEEHPNSTLPVNSGKDISSNTGPFWKSNPEYDKKLKFMDLPAESRKNCVSPQLEQLIEEWLAEQEETTNLALPINNLKPSSGWITSADLAKLPSEQVICEASDSGSIELIELQPNATMKLQYAKGNQNKTVVSRSALLAHTMLSEIRTTGVRFTDSTKLFGNTVETENFSLVLPTVQKFGLASYPPHNSVSSALPSQKSIDYEYGLNPFSLQISTDTEVELYPFPRQICTKYEDGSNPLSRKNLTGEEIEANAFSFQIATEDETGLNVVPSQNYGEGYFRSGPSTQKKSADDRTQANLTAGYSSDCPFQSKLCANYIDNNVPETLQILTYRKLMSPESKDVKIDGLSLSGSH